MFETIEGKNTRWMDRAALQARLDGCQRVLLDLGTGDGRFVLDSACLLPAAFAIGVDACRENLAENSRRLPPNALFVIANAAKLPAELNGLAAQVTINFPWGSLLSGLLTADPGLLDGLRRVMQPGAALLVRLNASALAEQGWNLVTGGARVREVLAQTGFALKPPALLGPADLRACPTTWAKKLAYGRRPEAVSLAGRL